MFDLEVYDQDFMRYSNGTNKTKKAHHADAAKFTNATHYIITKRNPHNDAVINRERFIYHDRQGEFLKFKKRILKTDKIVYR